MTTDTRSPGPKLRARGSTIECHIYRLIGSNNQFIEFIQFPVVSEYNHERPFRIKLSRPWAPVFPDAS